MDKHVSVFPVFLCSSRCKEEQTQDDLRMLVNELAGVVNLVVDHDEDVLSCVVLGHILICVLLFGHFCGLRILFADETVDSAGGATRTESGAEKRAQSQPRETGYLPGRRTANEYLPRFRKVSIRVS
jgi:hypothetical protein